MVTWNRFVASGNSGSLKSIELDMKSGNRKWHLSSIFQTIEPDSGDVAFRTAHEFLTTEGCLEFYIDIYSLG